MDNALEYARLLNQTAKILRGTLNKAHQDSRFKSRVPASTLDEETRKKEEEQDAGT